MTKRHFVNCLSFRRQEIEVLQSPHSTGGYQPQKGTDMGVGFGFVFVFYGAGKMFCDGVIPSVRTPTKHF
jgi:hypothetical protein